MDAETTGTPPQPETSSPSTPPAVGFAEAAWYWLHLGFISFGGPAGQIAIMQADCVDKKRWIDQQAFLRGLNYSMLLPGPEAQQLAAYIGWRLHGVRGAVAAGALFFLPGAILMMALAWIAAAHGDNTWVIKIFNGIKPAVIGIIVFAVWRIGKKTCNSLPAVALAAAAFVRIYGVGFLGRARSDTALHAHEVDRFMLGAMAALAAVCVLAGVLSAVVLDAIAPAAELVTRARLPVQLDEPWLTLTPIAESRSTYNGLLVFLFIAVSASLSAWAVHRFASRRVRRAPAWDCGFPDGNPITQYGAGSFAQPLRRVLGTVLMRAREEVDMPPPGDARPASHRVVLRDLIWDGLYQPIADAVAAVAVRANRLQFLTIRRYLSLVLGSLVALLLVLTIWG